MAQDRADVTMSRWLSIADLIEATTVGRVDPGAGGALGTAPQ